MIAGRQIDVVAAGKEGIEILVEVTGGTGSHKVGQVLKQMKDTGKKAILFGINLEKGMVREARRQGIQVAENLEELEQILRGQ